MSFLKLLALAACLAATTAQTPLTISYTSTLQTIDGFGVSQAFGRASELEALSLVPRQQGLDYLFNTSIGAGLSIIRIRIGSGSSGDSILPSSPGCSTCAPSYVWDGDDRGQVWFAKQANSYGIDSIYADAWSAPGFMKTNNNENNGGYLCGVTGRSCSSGDWRQAFADMLVQYVQYYADEGIFITHLGFLNEPDYVTSYSSMQSDGHEAASFLPILSDTATAAGLSIKLACCDALSWNSQKTFTSQIIADGAEEHLGLITSHMYAGDPNSVMDGAAGVSRWMTEGADLDSAWCTTWYANGGLCEGLTWAIKIATGVLDANLGGYIYWEGVEVNQFQAASYLVASDGTTVTPSGRLWAFAMWSRFVRPGAVRLSTSGTLSGVSWGAFKNTDGSVTAVLTNAAGSAQTSSMTVDGFIPTIAEAWITDNSRNVATYEVTLAGEAVTVSIPAYSVVTIKVNGMTG